MRNLIFIAAIALAGCASEADRAAEAFEMAKSSGASETELCRSAQQVAAAYGRTSDTAQAENWESWARIHCSLASLNEGYRY